MGPPARPGQKKKGGGLGWLIAAMVLLLLAGGGVAVWWFVIRDDSKKSKPVEEEETPRFVGDENTGQVAGEEAADEGQEEEPDAVDAEQAAATADDAAEVVEPNGEEAARVIDSVIGAASGILSGTGAKASPLGNELPTLVDADSLTVQQAVPITLERAEAGDPLYGLCREANLLDRCFVASLEGGAVAEITEDALGLKSAGLSIVERQHPFELLVVDGAIRLGVPEHYLWGQFTLQSRDGNQYLVLVYSKRALTRKGIATYTRAAETRMRELRNEYDVDASEPIPGFFPFYAELAELNGDSLTEIVAQGRQVRRYRDQRVPFSVVMTADGKQMLTTIDAIHPNLEIYTVNTAQGPVSLVAQGKSGCDVEPTLELWRLDAGTGTPVAWFDTFGLEQIQGLPQRYVEAGKSLRAVVVTDEKVLERIELFDSPERCQAVEEGYAIKW